ncbi:MAG TPA: DUF6647 family protein [Azospirillum sp.]
MLRFSIPFIGVLLGAAAAPLASAELSRCSPLDLLVEKVISRPIAYDEFCVSYPDQCVIDGESLIEMTPDRLRQLENVNKDINTEFELIPDVEWRGEEDVWSYPVLGHGDCEDFVLEKIRRLMNLGFSRAAMSIAIVYDKKLMSPHAILLVDTSDGTFVLDNLRDEVRCWDDVPYNYESRERPDSQWNSFDQSDWTWTHPLPNRSEEDNADRMLTHLLSWVADQAGLAAPEPPRIELVPWTVINARAFGDDSEKIPHLRIDGFYDIPNRIILLPSTWKADDPVFQSNLVHELTHHVQLSNGLRPRCLAELEPQAYDLQMRYLREQGVADPYAALGINEFTIRLASSCPDR